MSGIILMVGIGFAILVLLCCVFMVIVILYKKSKSRNGSIERKQPKHEMQTAITIEAHEYRPAITDTKHLDDVDLDISDHTTDDDILGDDDHLDLYDDEVAAKTHLKRKDNKHSPKRRKRKPPKRKKHATKTNDDVHTKNKHYLRKPSKPHRKRRGDNHQRHLAKTQHQEMHVTQRATDSDSDGSDNEYNVYGADDEDDHISDDDILSNLSAVPIATAAANTAPKNNEESESESESSSDSTDSAITKLSEAPAADFKPKPRIMRDDNSFSTIDEDEEQDSLSSMLNIPKTRIVTCKSDDSIISELPT